LQEADLHNIIIIICVYEDTSSENIRKARSVGFASGDLSMARIGVYLAFLA